MQGRTFLMEFEKGWKGFLLFLVIILIVAGGMVSLYPSITQTDEPELEGTKNVTLRVNETVGEINVSWKPVTGVDTYMVYADNRSSMVTAELVYNGSENNTVFEYDADEPLYYAVVGLKGEEKRFIGADTTAEKDRALEPLMETSYYTGLSGGRNISMYELKGFLSMEVFSWLFLLAGLYIGYISVRAVTKDIEESILDLIITSGISRKRYLVEKFASLSVYSLVVVTVAGSVMKLSANAIGEGGNLSWSASMLSYLAFWPVLLAVIAVAFLVSVYLKDSRKAVGLVFLFGFTQYAMQIVSNLSQEYKWVKDYCILGYWDYNSVLFDNVFKVSHFVGLLLLAVVIFIIAIYIFEEEDIPV